MNWNPIVILALSMIFLLYAMFVALTMPYRRDDIDEAEEVSKKLIRKALLVYLAVVMIVVICNKYDILNRILKK